MQTLAQIKSMLESRGLRPKRSLGQNFLIDHNLIRKLVEESGVRAGDTVLEVGPGTGTLTEELLSRGVRVVACELDDNLAAMLAERAAASEVPNPQNLTVVHGDCLDDKRTVSRAAMEAVARSGGGGGEERRPFALVANLPYGAATPLMLALLMHHPECRTLAVTVQREAADRMLAQPGSKDYGSLAVLVRALTVARRIATLPPECFWPRPEVTSAMVVAHRLEKPLTADAPALGEFCRKLFEHRRKQLGAVLGRGVDFAGAGVRPEQRAEELSIEQILRLQAVVPRE